jgi:hypothetical protein
MIHPAACCARLKVRLGPCSTSWDCSSFPASGHVPRVGSSRSWDLGCDVRMYQGVSGNSRLPWNCRPAQTCAHTRLDTRRHRCAHTHSRTHAPSTFSPRPSVPQRWRAHLLRLRDLTGFPNTHINETREIGDLSRHENALSTGRPELPSRKKPTRAKFTIDFVQCHLQSSY